MRARAKDCNVEDRDEDRDEDHDKDHDEDNDSDNKNTMRTRTANAVVVICGVYHLRSSLRYLYLHNVLIKKPVIFLLSSEGYYACLLPERVRELVQYPTYLLFFPEHSRRCFAILR